jgi:tetratricopeptide (TPR) repeat protein
VKCPRCGSENRDAVRYCEECGIGLAESCTRCGVEMPIGKRFCGAPAGDATDRHRSPEGYTPRHLAERILTARNDLEGERKHVTVLFADLKASRGGDLAPEPLPEQFLATVVDQMIDTVHKHEGTVNRVMGSSIMALFGAPLSHEDHAIRACHAALRAQEVVRSCVGLGEWERSLRYCRRALEHGVALNDLRLKVSALFRCASAHIQRGDPLTGIKYCEDALALCPLPFDAAAIKAIRGYGLVKAGKAEEGTADLEEARGWYERSGLGYTRVQAALWVAEGYLQLGKLSEAQALLASALRVCRESRYRHLEGIGLRLFGEALGLSDPTALAHLESATAILEEVDARNDVAKSLSARAALKKAAGDGLAARRLFEQALSMFKALGTLDEPVRVRAALAHLLDDSGVGGVGSAAGRIPA